MQHHLEQIFSPKVVFITERNRAGLSARERAKVWCRWKAGDSLHEIGRAFGKGHSSVRCLLLRHGGIVPAVRRRSLLALTLAEREDISRGIASAWSIREIAKRLDQAASTVAGNNRLTRDSAAVASAQLTKIEFISGKWCRWRAKHDCHNHVGLDRLSLVCCWAEIPILQSAGC